MKILHHTNLYDQLQRDHHIYYETGKSATDEERSVLNAVLRGIENALEILDGFPIEVPGLLPSLTTTVPDEDTERWDEDAADLGEITTANCTPPHTSWPGKEV